MLTHIPYLCLRGHWYRLLAGESETRAVWVSRCHHWRISELHFRVGHTLFLRLANQLQLLVTLHQIILLYTHEFVSYGRGRGEAVKNQIVDANLARSFIVRAILETLGDLDGVVSLHIGAYKLQ
jgi:hypothetical protein